MWPQDDPSSETPPSRFYDDDGRRLGVLGSDRARRAWYEQRGVEPPDSPSRRGGSPDTEGETDGTAT